MRSPLSLRVGAVKAQKGWGAHEVWRADVWQEGRSLQGHPMCRTVLSGSTSLLKGTLCVLCDSSKDTRIFIPKAWYLAPETNHYFQHAMLRIFHCAQKRSLSVAYFIPDHPARTLGWGISPCGWWNFFLSDSSDVIRKAQMTWPFRKACSFPLCWHIWSSPSHCVCVRDLLHSCWKKRLSKIWKWTLCQGATLILKTTQLPLTPSAQIAHRPGGMQWFTTPLTLQWGLADSMSGDSFSF